MKEYTTTTTTLRIEETLNIKAFKLVKENTKEEKGKYTSVTTITKKLREIDKTVKSSDIKTALNVLYEKIANKKIVYDLNGIKGRKQNLYPISINSEYEFETKSIQNTKISVTIVDFELKETLAGVKYFNFTTFDENGELIKLNLFENNKNTYNLVYDLKTSILGKKIITYVNQFKESNVYQILSVVSAEDTDDTLKIREIFKEDYDWLVEEAYSKSNRREIKTQRKSTGFKAVPTEDGFKNNNESLIEYQLTNLLNDTNNQVNHRSELTIIFSHLIKYMIDRAKNLKANYSVSSDKDFLAVLSFKTDFIDYLTKIYMVNYSNSKIEEALKSLEDLNIIKLISIDEMTKSASITLQKFNHDLKSATAFSINKDSVKLLKKHFNEDIEN